CGDGAAIVNSSIPFSCHVAVRHPLRISCFLSPRCIPHVFFDAATLRLFCSRRSAVRGCADVDLRHACLSRSRRDSQYPAAVAAKFLPWRLRAIGIAWRCGIEEGFAAFGGCLKMATEPILAALDVSAVQGRSIASSNVLFGYWELTKPEIN